MAEVQSLIKTDSAKDCSDLVDHFTAKLFDKYSECDDLRLIFHRYDILFLMDRKERIKLLQVGSCSCRGLAVTKLGPWLFLIMINDLFVADTILWKYVHNTTLVESVSQNGTSYMQLRVDELVRQSEADGFQLNESKCKELRISFSRPGRSVDHITNNGEQIEVVSSANLLGVVGSFG